MVGRCQDETVSGILSWDTSGGAEGVMGGDAERGDVVFIHY